MHATADWAILLKCTNRYLTHVTKATWLPYHLQPDLTRLTLTRPSSYAHCTVRVHLGACVPSYILCIFPMCLLTRLGLSAHFGARYTRCTPAPFTQLPVLLCYSNCSSLLHYVYYRFILLRYFPTYSCHSSRT